MCYCLLQYIYFEPATLVQYSIMFKLKHARIHLVYPFFFFYIYKIDRYILIEIVFVLKWISLSITLFFLTKSYVRSNGKCTSNFNIGL